MQCQPTTRYFRHRTVPSARKVWKHRESRKCGRGFCAEVAFSVMGMESKTGEEADYEGQVCHRATDSEAKVGQASATPRRGSA